jgi:hypothetical protein
VSVLTSLTGIPLASNSHANATKLLNLLFREKSRERAVPRHGVRRGRYPHEFGHRQQARREDSRLRRVLPPTSNHGHLS